MRRSFVGDVFCQKNRPVFTLSSVSNFSQGKTSSFRIAMAEGRIWGFFPHGPALAITARKHPPTLSQFPVSILPNKRLNRSWVLPSDNLPGLSVCARKGRGREGVASV